MRWTYRMFTYAKLHTWVEKGAITCLFNTRYDGIEDGNLFLNIDLKQSIVQDTFLSTYVNIFYETVSFELEYKNRLQFENQDCAEMSHGLPSKVMKSKTMCFATDYDNSRTNIQ